MVKFISVLIFIAFSYAGIAQSITQKINSTKAQLESIEKQRLLLLENIETLKLEKIQEDLEQVGLPGILPGDELVKHAAIVLGFSPKFKQARWVSHIIIPDVINGVVFRTNDFRPDSAIKSGSAVEADYFLKFLQPDSTYKYDAFGYDRGHLAPSADFRWSKKALSESYFYSNMSPQLADFNRGSWGELEDAIRGYIYRHPASQLHVVTGPFLEDGLPKIERGINKVSIPKRYWKVVMDLTNKKAIGFIMPNEAIKKPLKSFAVPVNEIEKQTGLNFFSKLSLTEQELLESQADASAWLPETSTADAEPLEQEKLPRGHFNTLVAQEWMNRNNEINVCGTVVSARISRSGNILLNLDKQFPKQIFTVFIKKEHIINFNYKPELLLKGKIICVKGKVIDLSGTAAMYIENESDLKIQ
ncbi:MAG: DNA/RNA non-specific endonuclease [Ferruginibacter sp.]